MRHCVYGYQDLCIKGSISIWSMKKCLYKEDKGIRSVTIELGNDGTIVQARGIANRYIRSDEEKVLKKWAQVNYLKIGRI